MKRIILGLTCTLALAVMPLAAGSNHHHSDHSDDGHETNITIDTDDDDVSQRLQPGQGALRGRAGGARRGEPPGVGADASSCQRAASMAACMSADGIRAAGRSRSARRPSMPRRSTTSASVSPATSSRRIPRATSVRLFLIKAPHNATLDVDSTNGPIGLYEVNGTLSCARRTARSR